MNQPSISTEAALTPAQDFEVLRQEGIRRLQEMSGQVWTDYNVQDPGVTILEQLCYALTDLAYRIGHPLPDLLTGPAGQPFAPFLYSARSILSTGPVSPDDFRRLLFDVEGVKNAWVEIDPQPYPLLVQPASDPNIRLVALGDMLVNDGGNVLPDKGTPIRGLLRVSIEPDLPIDLTDPTEFLNALRDRVSARLLAARGLGGDVSELRLLEAENLSIEAEIEAAEGVDAADLLVQIYARLDLFISPRQRFYSLREMLDKGYAMEEIVAGPALNHGYLDPVEISNFDKKDFLRGSDLIRVLMDIPGVRLVRRLKMVALDQNNQPAKSAAWSIPLDPNAYPRLLIPTPQNPDWSPIRLKRGQFALSVTGFQDKWNHWLGRPLPLPAGQSELDAPPRPGRYRHPGLYQSVQRQFPLLYGIGDAGLPRNAGPQRQALAKQLKAYLLFFDQVLANGFAQLEGFGALFSLNNPVNCTYFAQVPDDVPALDSLLTESRAKLAEILPKLLEPTVDTGEGSRIQRLLNHLLARFGEQFPDQNLLRAGDVLNLKKTLLQHYPAWSSGRGTGVNYAGTTDVANLERRIAKLLGIPDSDGQALYSRNREGFWLLEHVLLRPLPIDREQYDIEALPPGSWAPDLNAPKPQRIPVFLYRPASSDPFSLQLSIVFPAWAGRFAALAFRQFAERLIRAEVPAHFRLNVYWLDQSTMQQIETPFFNWRNRLSSAKRPLWTISAPDDAAASLVQLQIRAARNALIDGLVFNGSPFGYAYPVLNLPIDLTTPRVLEGTQASITLRFNEAGVRYQLWDLNRGAWSGPAVNGTGQADPGIVLSSDPLGMDIRQQGETVITRFDILAVKTVAGVTLPPVRLQNRISVEIRLLLWNLVVEIADEKTEIDYDGGTTVRIHQPQVGVQYTLHTALLQDSDYEYVRKADGTLAYQINANQLSAADKDRVYTRQDALNGKVDQPADTLDIEVPAASKILQEDTVLKLECKFVETANNPNLGSSNVVEFLDARVFVFVRPDPGVKGAKDAANPQQILINKPQAGVLYTLLMPDGTPVAARAYRPGKALPPDAKGDTGNANTAFRVEVDFAVDAVTTPPLALPLPPISATTTFALKAQKMNTKLASDLPGVKITK